MKKGYCEKCDKLVNYNIIEADDIFELRGKEYKYTKKVGCCEFCGEEVANNDIMDENLNRIDEAYRAKEGIIKTNEINSILNKYKIGKKPLSKLLGWGETTLIRYMNGDVPTKQYSEELYKLFNDIRYMENLLDRNKSNITDRAYAITKKAITDMKHNKNADNIETEIELIAEYIIYTCKEVTPLALQKILYYAQGFYKSFSGEFLFSDNCEAWVHGPVYRKIYDKYKEYGSSNIDANIDYDVEDILIEDKKEMLDIIVKCFGYYNGKALEKMTHYESPWINARKGLNEEENTNKLISKSDMEEYFAKIRAKYDMLNILEIQKYSKEHFDRVIYIS